MRKLPVFIIILLLMFAGLAYCVQSGFSAKAEDSVYNCIAATISPPMTGVLKVITRLGNPEVVMIFSICLLAVKRTRNTIAWPVCTSIALATILNQILKRVFMRERPDILRLITETNYSFPSGHAMVSAAMYSMLILMTLYYIKSPYRRMTYTALFLFIWMAIGISRVYLGVHYAGDIVGGWLLGVAVTATVYTLWDAFAGAWIEKAIANTRN